MPKVELATPERLAAREIWPDEALHFTPWLAENLHLLGEALGSDLRLIGTEQQVGRYFLDIFAEMDGYDRVAIENQFGTTDQDHFGQLITKGAGLDASVLIWVSEWFTNEHLTAVNRLNTEMRGGLQLFAVELQPYRIGQSDRALNFKVVAHPHGWNPPSESTPDLRTRRGNGFFERLCKESGDQRMTSGGNSGFSFMAGAPALGEDDSISYTIRFRGSDNTSGTSVHLWIETESRQRNLAIFRALQGDRADIESQVGQSMSWQEQTPGGKACAVRAHGSGSIDDPPGTLAETRADMLARYRNLRAALDKRLPAAIAAAEQQ